MSDLTKAIAASILGNLDEMRSEMMSVLNAKAAEALDAKKAEIGMSMFGGEMVSEGKWEYPKKLTSKPVEKSDMGNTNQADLRKERKAFRKKKKAEAHKKLMTKEEVVSEGKLMGTPDHAGDANAKWADRLERNKKRRKKVKVLTKEETEDLQELSTKLLKRYIKKGE